MRSDAVIIAAAVTVIFNLVDALAPNTPNYYNRNEGWDNDGVRFHLIDTPSDILIHVDEEAKAINTKNANIQQAGRCLNSQQRKKIADQWSKS